MRRWARTAVCKSPGCVAALAPVPSAVVHVTDDGTSVVPVLVTVSVAVSLDSEPVAVAGLNWNVGLSAASVIVPMALFAVGSTGGALVPVGVPKATVKYWSPS